MSGWLRDALTDPRVRGACLDEAASTLAQREILRTKPLARRVFERFYTEALRLDRAWFGTTPGPRWEIGSGAGFLKEVVPDVVTSDVKALPWVDVVADACGLPVRTGALRSIWAFNVFHHVRDPRAFLREAARAVAPGGGVVLVEPYHGAAARFVFRRLHASEGFEPDAGWEADETRGPMTRANQALAYVVFERDRAVFEAEFPELRLVHRRPHTHLLYLASGGVNFRSLAPAAAGPLLEGIEAALSPLSRVLSLQQTLVLRRT